ncbi:MAG: hypothetical protein EZS28_010493 [Streblomastix strix]|uniref:Uncharacterized protein n=1 Tax=Streblomastix strix TaxID=222440 RepID=A0A5J4WI41_9EUKA|nr:MAG: hypothetical protein EZS28_010493 [Streblomastix strix]
MIVNPGMPYPLDIHLMEEMELFIKNGCSGEGKQLESFCDCVCEGEQDEDEQEKDMDDLELVSAVTN